MDMRADSHIYQKRFQKTRTIESIRAILTELLHDIPFEHLCVAQAFGWAFVRARQIGQMAAALK
jgi:hypothetical protein